MTKAEKQALIDRVDTLPVSKYATPEYRDMFKVIAAYICKGLHITEEGTYTINEVYDAAVYAAMNGYALAKDNRQKK